MVVLTLMPWVRVVVRVRRKFRVVKLKFSSIRRQFLLLMLLLMVVMVTAYSLVAHVIKDAQNVSAAKQEIETLTHALEHDYAEIIALASPKSSQKMIYKWRSFPSILQAGLEDSLAKPVLSFAKESNTDESVKLGANERFSVNNEKLFFKLPIMQAGRQIGSVTYIVLTDYHKNIWGELKSTLVISIPLALLLVACLISYLQRVVVTPLERLIDRLATIVEQQDYRAIVDVDAVDCSEFASLGRSFNALLARVQQSILSANEAEAQARELSKYDALTGLANRRLLVERMEYVLQIAIREKKHGALLFIDLDNFKTLNDSRGHAAGDDLLKKVAANLKKVFRKEDTVARLGGDEFVILSGRLEDSEKAAANQVESLILKLQDILSESFTVQGELYQLTASVGITTFPHLANTPADLMKQADTAMYRAKEAGRDTYRFYQPAMQAAADARLTMERELRHAIKNEEFELFYQPQVDEFGRILGAEALLRWFKAGGMVSPADFIPVAEVTGLILPIGDRVLKQGFTQLKQWLDDGLVEPSFSLSINISPLQFHQDTFVEDVKRLLQETGVLAKNVTLEVTEGIAIKDILPTVEKMQALNAVGFKVSMDDFGTGYSSLTYLKKLPLSELKIDQSFVRDLDVDKADAELVATIIAMAKNLHLEVVAEGVETEGQLRFLCRHGCTTFQGYYFHKPMASTGLTELLSGNLIII